MKGSLEAPPIVIYSSRVVSLVGLIVGLGAFAYEIARLVRPFAVPSLIDYLWLLASGLGCLVFSVQLISPSYFKLTPNGLTYRAGFGSEHWAWCEISDIRAGYWGHINIEFEIGIDGAFGVGWEGGAASVVSTLNAARARWL